MARGDHLFVYAWGYSHHGIDCGDGTVIHFDGGPWQVLLGGRAGGEPVVCRSGWDEFHQNRPIFVRQHEIVFPPDEVVRRAESRLGETDYRLFRNNCEHFAVWCKTGLVHSTQADAARHAMQGAMEQLPVSLAMLRVARLLPAQFRLAAMGAAVGASAGRVAGKYLRHRLAQMRNQES